jgi:hypothetical protein
MEFEFDPIKVTAIKKSMGLTFTKPKPYGMILI